MSTVRLLVPDDHTMSLRLLTRLRMQGFQLSLDDFGTGYGSMSRLARLPFSEIKIDRSFVASALTSEDSGTLVRAVVDLGLNLGLTTVAEGVEDAATMQLLDDIGATSPRASTWPGRCPRTRPPTGRVACVTRSGVPEGDDPPDQHRHLEDIS